MGRVAFPWDMDVSIRPSVKILVLSTDAQDFSLLICLKACRGTATKCYFEVHLHRLVFRVARSDRQRLRS